MYNIYYRMIDRDKLTSEDMLKLLKMLEEPGTYVSLFIHIDNGRIVHVEKVDKIRRKDQLENLLKNK